MTKQDWYMNPMERSLLAEWLAQYAGHMILNADVLSTLDNFGIKWNPGTRRLTYMRESAEVMVYSPAYFNQVLMKAGGRGHVSEGNWLGVWALDVASAILSLALGTPDPTVALIAKSNRYKTIVTLLRPEGDVIEPSGMVGEIRG